MAKAKGKRSEEAVPWGVPLGGVGAGCVELGGDGRFRNITINNNRGAETRIQLSQGAFIALRTVRQGKVQTRFLQPGNNLPFHEAGIIPTFTPAKQLTWRGLYPCAFYTLGAPNMPLNVSWRAFSPVIPHDLASSTLPVILFDMSLQNTGDVPVSASAAINWENLCGCTRDDFPADRGGFRLIPVETGPAQDQPPKAAGLTFGAFGEPQSNASGNYTLAALPQYGVDTTVMAWNERDPDELDTFWQQFHYEGRLNDSISRCAESHSASVCCSLDVEPGQTRRIVFALSWYCPRFEVDGYDQGNAYAKRFRNSAEVATHALKHFQFLLNAVDNWHKRMFSSSLPRWFTRMLVNSSSVLSTNTILTRDSRFGMFETPAAPRTGAMDRRIYSSIGTLLFFPELEEREMLQFARTTYQEAPGRMYRYLGDLCVHKPSMGDGPDELMDINAKFVLMAYRDFQMTGDRRFIESVFPRLTQAMEHGMSHDRDGDGLPEQSGVSTTFDDWAVYGVNSYTAGLWIAAMRAYARIAEHMGMKDETTRYRELAAKAARGLEERLWNDDGGFYRLYNDGSAPGADHDQLNDACHTGQMAGEWYAKWLCLGGMLDPRRVRRALGSIQRLNDRKTGVANGSMADGSPCGNPASTGKDPHCADSWPSISAANYGCLLMHNGRVDHGLYAIEQIYRNIHLRGARAFNLPLGWDPDANEPCEWGSDRHMGALSIWHAFCSLQGFLMDVAAQTMWIRPNLPMGVHFLNTPLFTPTTFGWLRFQEDDEDGYRVRLQVSFEQPVLVMAFMLRVPTSVEGASVQCATPEGSTPTRHVYRKDGAEKLVDIRPEKPVVVREGLTVLLRQVDGEKVRFPGPAR